LTTKLLAVVTGIATGAFLFAWYAPLQIDNFWGLHWYEGALLLAALGIGGLFPGGWLVGTVGMGIVPFLSEGIRTYLALSRDPSCCNLWPIGLAMWLVLGFPAPIIGGALGRTLHRVRIPRALYFIPLAGGLAIGALLPRLQSAEYRSVVQQMPSLLQRIYQAQLSYQAARPDHTFACDGRQLPDVATLRWTSAGGHTARLLIVGHYSVVLECRDAQHTDRFRVRAFSRHNRTRTDPAFLIDQTGQLLTGEPGVLMKQAWR
jgi:hypothetical protein